MEQVTKWELINEATSMDDLILRIAAISKPVWSKSKDEKPSTKLFVGDFLLEDTVKSIKLYNGHAQASPEDIPSIYGIRQQAIYLRGRWNQE